MAPFSEARIRPTANTDLKKFGYKPMGMKLSEASEILDDRIDEFATIFQEHYNSDELTFGSAAVQSTSEIIAVGRIASDSLEGKLNPASLMLETSRRTGAGRRVPLKIDAVPGLNFFPGQIVALRGINPSGEYFTVKEILPLPLLPPAASSAVTLENINDRLEGGDANPPLNVLVAAGPYTADDNLDFEPLQELCQKAADSYADGLVLLGPFLDIEHPMLASGDFDLPEIKGLDPDTATLTTLFRHCISTPLARLAGAVPSITIVCVPSVRDVLNRHVSWPQEQIPKKDLGLPKQVRMVSNPVTLSFNEIVVGMCSHDVLSELRREEVLHGRPAEGNLLTRLPKYLVEQRHFFPLFPPTARANLPKPGSENGVATGAMLDVPYMKLGEWWNVRPDVLIVPSMLPPFVKVCFLSRSPILRSNAMTGRRQRTRHQPGHSIKTARSRIFCANGNSPAQYSNRRTRAKTTRPQALRTCTGGYQPYLRSLQGQFCIISHRVILGVRSPAGKHTPVRIQLILN